MWGSDWPVCDVGGPAGRNENWALWRDVVAEWLEGKGDEVGEWIWWRAGWEAYGLGDSGE